MIVIPEIPNAVVPLRSHPWNRTADDEGGYYDFITHPELISEVLEDFVPFADRPAIKRFYEFLRWINGPESSLETNDCALAAPVDAADPLFPGMRRIGGRIELFHREHLYNCDQPRFDWLHRVLFLYLQARDQEFVEGVVTIGLRPTQYLSVQRELSVGSRLSLRFDAFGRSDTEAFENLDRLFAGIWEGVRRTDAAKRQRFAPLL